jgi:predicted peroxiredoxin
MIAYCGLECEKCEAFIATEKNDDRLRAEVAEKWARLYNAPVKPEHINCTGCKSSGVKTFYCEQMCEIRKCATGKKLENSTCIHATFYLRY